MQVPTTGLGLTRQVPTTEGVYSHLSCVCLYCFAAVRLKLLLLQFQGQICCQTIQVDIVWWFILCSSHVLYIEIPTIASSTVNIIQTNVIHSETGKMPVHLKRKYQDQVRVNNICYPVCFTVCHAGLL